MKKYTLTRELIKKINEKEKELSFGEIGIRSLAEDKQYSVGEYCRNSYDWDHEHDCSTYNTDPVELNEAAL